MLLETDISFNFIDSLLPVQSIFQIQLVIRYILHVI